MAQINFTIPDEKISLVLDSFATVYGFVPGQGETKAQFTKGKIRDFIKDIVARAQGAEARRIAAEAVQSTVDAIDIS